jgi:ClpP class serine protease
MAKGIALDAVLSQPWAIAPEYLATIASIAARQRRSGDFKAALAELRAIEPRAFDDEPGHSRAEPSGVRVVDNVAVVKLYGPIFPRANLMCDISGGTSLDLFAKQLRAADAMPGLRAILIDCDSPGGVVADIAATATMIAGLEKPVTAFVRQTCCSAAYWLCAAADRIATARTGQIGSIGVVCGVSKQEAPDSEGFRDYEIVSTNAPNKRPDPATEEGRESIRAFLDPIEAQFIGDVARFRTMTADGVIEAGRQGSIVVGADAVAAGLCDEVADFEEVFAGLAGGSTAPGPAPSTGSGPPASTPEGSMDLKTLKEKHADVAAALIKEGADAAAAALAAAHGAALQAARVEATAAGRAAEAARIADLEAHSVPGFEAEFAAAKADPNATGKDLAASIVKSARAQGAAKLAALAAAEVKVGAEAPKPTPTPAIAPNAPGAPTDPDAIDKAAWDADASLRKDFGDSFKAYRRFKDDERAGNLRQYGTQPPKAA